MLIDHNQYKRLKTDCRATSNSKKLKSKPLKCNFKEKLIEKYKKIVKKYNNQKSKEKKDKFLKFIIISSIFSN